MRMIDRNAGVPLCALSSLLFRLVRPLRKPVRPKNVLLIELSEMGSAILVDPAMEKLKEQGANLHFLIFRKNKASLDLLRTVPEENIFTIGEGGIGELLGDTLRFLSWARKRQIDSVIDLELFSRFTALLAAYSGARNIVGFHRFHSEGVYRGEMLTHRVLYNPHVHITRNFLSLVHALYAEEPEVPFAKIRVEDDAITLKKTVVAQEDVEAVAAKIAEAAPGSEGRPIVLINANASDLLPQRRWARESFAQLIRMILAHAPDVQVLLTGAPPEREGLEVLARQVDDPRCVNFAGAIPFRQLTALYHQSVLMVTNDSGPAHFASTTRMPTVVLFGPETPALYGALGETYPIFAGLNCSPCVSAWNHRKTACTDNKCLQAITPAQVMEVVARLLEDPGHRAAGLRQVQHTG